MDSNFFKFPFAPYPIQIEFMNKLYQCIEEKKIGLLESPTGTGKTLSLICGAMKWLRDHESEPFTLEQIQEKKVSSFVSNLVWENAHFDREKHDEKNTIIKEHEEFYASLNKKLKMYRNDENIPISSCNKTFAKSSSTKPSSVVENPDYLLDYDSDNEFTKNIDYYECHNDRITQDFTCRKIFLCSRTHSQISQIVREYSRTFWSEEGRIVVLGSRKLMCLNPLVNRLSTKNQINDKCLELVPNVLVNELVNPKNLTEFSNSPQSSCPFFQKTSIETFKDYILAKPRDIEDLVSDGKKLMACPYYATRFTIKLAEIVILPYYSLIHEQVRKSLGIDLKGHIVIFDEAHNLIETINAIYSNEVTLLQFSQGLAQLEQYLNKYKDLLKSSNTSHIEKIVYVLKAFIKVLESYVDDVSNAERSSGVVNSEYEPRLENMSVEEKKINGCSNKNMCNNMKKRKFAENEFLHMDYNTSFTDQIIRQSDTIESKKLNLVSNLPSDKSYVFEKQFTSAKFHDSNTKVRIFKLNEFLYNCNLDNINLFQLNKFIVNSNLISKVQGFSDSTQIEVRKLNCNKFSTINLSKDDFEKHRPALSSISQFLVSLTNLNNDGRILINIDTNSSKCFIKYVSLNPESYFQPIFNDARSVIMVGGTMQPFEDFKNYLLNCDDKSNDVGASNLTREIETFTCSHIIADSNLATFVLKSGPTGLPLVFNYEKRHNLNVQLEAGRVLVNLTNVIPDGIVVFFPSYDYEEKIWETWRSNNIVESIKKNKTIFRESRDACNVEVMLRDYANAIERKTLKGAVLICVTGGKLSEGINFKDHLGRGIVVFGLPYPNPKDVILQEKMSFVKNKFTKEGKEKLEVEKLVGEYVDNICMRVLNQSIGRSIRHQKDYAVIVLIDERYQMQRIRNKLPSWISKTVNMHDSFGMSLKSIANFFQKKNSCIKISQ